MARTPPTPQPKLSRDVIVEAAIALVETEGLDALSMRRVAAHLDRAPMSLYRHVRNRDDLLTAMLDTAASRIETPDRHADPREEVVAIMVALHRRLRAEPWLVQLLLFEGRFSAHIFPLIERVFAALDTLLGDVGNVVDVYAILQHYLYGECLSYQTRAQRLAFQNALPHDTWAAYPVTARVFNATRDHAFDEFERNVRRVLDTT
ncbi:MAG: helix-turn-helix domain-containing protein [Pseudomonadota bacterium]